jgi:integrase
MPFLTDTIIRALPLPAKGNKVHFDQPDPTILETTDVVTAGLGIRITAAGHRAWVFRYQLKDGSGDYRKLTLGRYPYLAIAIARKRARQLRAEIEGGADPQGDKAAKRGAPTVAKLADLFEAEQGALIRAKDRRESTLVLYQRLVRIYILPELGRLKVADVTKADVKRMHRTITATGKRVQANRVVALLSAMMTFAIDEDMRTDNPCAAVDRNPEQPRIRDITPTERGRLTEELAKHDTASARALKLLLVTGARRGEVLGMRWTDLTLGGQPSWNRKGANLKGGRDHTVPLNGVAAQLLMMIQDETIARDGQLGEYVFPSDTKSRHIADIQKMWLTILKRAGISDLHIHDLRHHYASELASSGSSLPLIGALLGHRSASSTARYIRLFQDAQREASERAGAAIMGGTSSDNVIPMKKII